MWSKKNHNFHSISYSKSAFARTDMSKTQLKYQNIFLKKKKILLFVFISPRFLRLALIQCKTRWKKQWLILNLGGIKTAILFVTRKTNFCKIPRRTKAIKARRNTNRMKIGSELSISRWPQWKDGGGWDS